MTKHAPDCRWERLTSAECAYRDTHYFCPHPEHACTCPPADAARFWFWKLRVCLYCYWYLRHWPASDISDAEWREYFNADETAWDTFIEGWGRSDDMGDLPP